MHDERTRNLAIHWQHTRCRIGRVWAKDRHPGIVDIGHADEKVWAVWSTLGDLLQANQVASACAFGTLHDGASFTMIGRGPENIATLIGSSVQMTWHLKDYRED